MSIYARLCADIASVQRRIEHLKSEADHLSREGLEDIATIYRQGAASTTEWLEYLNNEKTEIEAKAS